MPGHGVDWTGVSGALGRELTFRGSGGRLMRTFVGTDGRTGPIERHPCFREESSDLVAFAVLSDGRVLGVQLEPAEREGRALTLRLGWGAALGR